MLTRERVAFEQIKADTAAMEQPCRMAYLRANRHLVETVLECSESRVHWMLDRLYGERAQLAYIRDCIENFDRYMTMRQTETSVRELAAIFGGTAISGELDRAHKRYCMDFRRLARKTKKPARRKAHTTCSSSSHRPRTFEARAPEQRP